MSSSLLNIPNEEFNKSMSENKEFSNSSIKDYNCIKDSSIKNNSLDKSYNSYSSIIENDLENRELLKEIGNAKINYLKKHKSFSSDKSYVDDSQIAKNTNDLNSEFNTQTIKNNIKDNVSNIKFKDSSCSSSCINRNKNNIFSNNVNKDIFNDKYNDISNKIKKLNIINTSKSKYLIDNSLNKNFYLDNIISNLNQYEIDKSPNLMQFVGIKESPYSINTNYLKINSPNYENYYLNNDNINKSNQTSKKSSSVIPNKFKEDIHNNSSCSSNISKKISPYKIINDILDKSLNKKEDNDYPLQKLLFETLLLQIENNKLTKHNVKEIIECLENAGNDKINEFISFLSNNESNLYNFCSTNGVINIIKPLIELFYSVNKTYCDLFITIFLNKLNVFIYDNRMYKLIEQILKLDLNKILIIKSNALYSLRLALIKNMLDYSSHPNSCHVIKVYFSVSKLTDEEFNMIYKQISENFIEFSINETASSLLISSLYVRIYIIYINIYKKYLLIIKILQIKYKHSIINISLDIIITMLSNKVSVGVLEKFIEHGGKIYVDSFLEKIINVNIFNKMLLCPQGFEILKKAFKHANKSKIQYFANKMKPYIESLDNDKLKNDLKELLIILSTSDTVSGSNSNMSNNNSSHSLNNSNSNKKKLTNKDSLFNFSNNSSNNNSINGNNFNNIKKKTNKSNKTATNNTTSSTFKARNQNHRNSFNCLKYNIPDLKNNNIDYNNSKCNNIKSHNNLNEEHCNNMFGLNNTNQYYSNVNLLSNNNLMLNTLNNNSLSNNYSKHLTADCYYNKSLYNNNLHLINKSDDNSQANKNDSFILYNNSLVNNTIKVNSSNSEKVSNFFNNKSLSNNNFNYLNPINENMFSNKSVNNTDRSLANNFNNYINNRKLSSFNINRNDKVDNFYKSSNSLIQKNVINNNSCYNNNLNYYLNNNSCNNNINFNEYCNVNNHLINNSNNSNFNFYKQCNNSNFIKSNSCNIEEIYNRENLYLNKNQLNYINNNYSNYNNNNNNNNNNCTFILNNNKLQNNNQILKFNNTDIQ